MSRGQLVIEVDGGQHFDAKGVARDARRDAYLAAEGYRVLRFTNLDVLKNKSGVLETIGEALASSRAPSLALPASGGGETGSSATDHTRTTGGEELQ